MVVKKGMLLDIDHVNPHVRKMKNPLVGPIAVRARELERELNMGAIKPFKEVIKTNIGDGHAMGMSPLTFVRQLFALVSCPHLLEDPSFPDDIKEKANEILNACSNRSIGSYTHGAGIAIIRQHVADFITRRDGGIASDWENIILTTGATIAIKSCFNLIATTENNKRSGALVPIPIYPIYYSVLDELNIEAVGYYLDEPNKWKLDIDTLEKSLIESKKKCNPKVLVVINPGNPTGQVLPKQNMKEIIKLAHRERLIIFADEVYQDNIYDSEFHSFKKVMIEMGSPYSEMELVSFNSASKGFMGECASRGGYMELVNFCPEVQHMLFKYVSAMLCTNILGQVAIECLVNPPKLGDLSYELYVKEKSEIIKDLKYKANLIVDGFNSIDGVVCNPVQGAMYAFPKITLPTKAIEAAERAGQKPDEFYGFQLLESTGICVLPGSDFGQKKNTFHIRTTILPSTEKMKTMIQKFSEFHIKFMKKYQ